MKVLFFSPRGEAFFNDTSFFPYGGAEVQMYNFAKFLSRNEDVEVCFITGYRETPAIKRDGRLYCESVYKIGAKNIFSKVASLLTLFYRLCSLQADVYIERNAGFETFAVYAASRLLNKKFVYMVSHIIDVNGEYFKRGIKGSLFKAALKGADLISFQTYGQVELLKKSGIGFKNYVVVRNGFEARIPKKTDRRYLSWVGRAVREKRPELFVEMKKMLPELDFKLILMPSDDEEYFNEVASVALEAGIDVLKGIAVDEVDVILMESLFLVHTSLWEGLSNSFIQGLRNGVPVISFGYDPDNIVSEYGVGIVADNLSDAVSAVDALLSDEKRREEISGNCYNTFYELFDIGKNSKLLTDKLSELYYGRIYEKR